MPADAVRRPPSFPTQTQEGRTSQEDGQCARTQARERDRQGPPGPCERACQPGGAVQFLSSPRLVPRPDRVGLRASSTPAVALASDGTATAPTSRPRLWGVGGRADRPHEVPRADERLCHVSCGAGRCTIGIGADARGSREMLSDQEMRQQAIRRKRGSTASSMVDTVAASFRADEGHVVGGARSQ